jgi:hypothetical protein
VEDKLYSDSLCALINTITDTGALARPPTASLLKGITKPDENFKVSDYIQKRAKWLSLKHATGANLSSGVSGCGASCEQPS